jgi:uncharacterized protein with GYD domain
MTTDVSTSAHLLLQAYPGRADDLASYLGTIDAVTETAVTSGPYDVIARVDLSDQDLAHVLVLARRGPGLARVCVCRAG